MVQPRSSRHNDSGAWLDRDAHEDSGRHPGEQVCISGVDSRSVFLGRRLFHFPFCLADGLATRTPGGSERLWRGITNRVDRNKRELARLAITAAAAFDHGGVRPL